MNCKTCGAEILSGRKFCTACGAPVTEAPLTVVCIACSNPVDANFCGECGRALKVAPASAATSARATRDESDSRRQTPDAERRQLTVQFCDLRARELSMRFDPEDLRDIVSAYHRLVAETVARFDGYVAKYMGHGVLVYFGSRFAVMVQLACTYPPSNFNAGSPMRRQTQTARCLRFA